MGKVRTFETGATRDGEDGKHDPEGFISPLVVDRYNHYMHSHRLQTDGKMRDSDNWQKGIPKTQYVKSLWRHFLDFWLAHRGYPVFDRVTRKRITQREAACGILFNIMGWMHEDELENFTQGEEHERDRS